MVVDIVVVDEVAINVVVARGICAEEMEGLQSVAWEHGKLTRTWNVLYMPRNDCAPFHFPCHMMVVRCVESPAV